MIFILALMKKMIQLCSILMLITSCSNEVYVCMGGFARRYHRSESCEGLRNCGGVIKPMTKEEAQKMAKTPCHICYSKRYR